MKSLSLFVSAAALLSASSAFALDCGTLPTCESLGYKDKKAECPASKFLICPFDENMGKCMHDAAIGDLKYSLKTSNHDGWILCNGQSVSKTTYSALFNVIGTNYGGSGDNFNLPDYRGYFLRAAGTASSLSSYGGSANSDMKNPQKEELPNITGSLAVDDSMVSKQEGLNSPVPTGVFKSISQYTYGSFDVKSNSSSLGYKVDFSATNSSTIYKAGGHVIPANYAANIFIYAGK